MSKSNAPTQRRYPPELRERTVRMAKEVIAQGWRPAPRRSHPGCHPLLIPRPPTGPADSGLSRLASWAFSGPRVFNAARYDASLGALGPPVGPIITSCRRPPWRRIPNRRASGKLKAIQWEPIRDRPGQEPELAGQAEGFTAWSDGRDRVNCGLAAGIGIVAERDHSTHEQKRSEYSQQQCHLHQAPKQGLHA